MEKLDQDKKKIVAKIAATIRQLTIDATENAKSGHPGLPLGCAELGAYLYGFALRHNPKNPHWVNRDRLVLSAGHGSLWLYASLHLAGFDLPLQEIKKFRKLHSQTPGHPEYKVTPGVEATTGPLGQGAGNAVGMALGLKILADKFSPQLFNAKVYCLTSDGDMMEGVCSEASSLAGHLNLNNLIFFYDSNQVTLDGPLSDCFSEDTLTRYKSYGWDVYEIDGYDIEGLHELVVRLREKQERPAFVKIDTLIGKGSPNKAGSFKVHGTPLGSEEAQLTKEALGLSSEEFHIPNKVKSFFENKLLEDRQREEAWKEEFKLWAKQNSDKAEIFKKMQKPDLGSLEEKLSALKLKTPLSGRAASEEVIQLLAEELPDLYGGSADLSSSDRTFIKKYPIIRRKDFAGRNIKFGVREFGMGAIASGLALTQLIRPFVGTFLTFSDYMRNAIRLAALSKLPVIYQFTHDSLFLGEDGPTHQPIEHCMALRAIPNLQVIRPADNNEVKMAWLAALRYAGPTALLLSRQNLPELQETNLSYHEGLGRGAYIIKKEERKPDYMLVATGSEVALALAVAEELIKKGKATRVISMPCWELFEAQDSEYKKAIFGGDLGKRVSIEAGVDLGWHKYIGMEGIAISMDTFGASASASALAEAFGFTVDHILERILG